MLLLISEIPFFDTGKLFWEVRERERVCEREGQTDRERVTDRESVCVWERECEESKEEWKRVHDALKHLNAFTM